MSNKVTIEEEIENFDLVETEEFLKNRISHLDLHEGNRALKTIVIKLIGEIKGIKEKHGS